MNVVKLENTVFFCYFPINPLIFFSFPHQKYTVFSLHFPLLIRGGVTVAEPDLGGVPRPSDDIQTPYSTSMSELRRKLILLEVQSSARSSLPVSLPIHPTPEKLKLWFPTVNAGVTPPPAAPRYPAVTWWRPTHSRNMSEYKHSFGRSFLARTDKI